jgi:beta-aspartyl-peptidase (threonine type)
MTERRQGFVLAVHGGAGTITEDRGAVGREALHAGLRHALAAGEAVLAIGGLALDAVTAAVVALEDNPLFNAGRGSVYTAARTQEMDASIMDGRDRRAGAVGAIFGPRNPVQAARAVMEHSPHVLLVGAGAEAFCRERGVAFEDAAYFASPERLRDLDQPASPGTVGAVARDRAGNLAAATSTGGMTGKCPGRVGDSAIIGAGTFADNASCAVSATGHGEFFIRFGAAFAVAARLRHGGRLLAEATQDVLAELGAVGGAGGVVAIDRQGSLALPFNTAGMYRGFVREGGPIATAIRSEPFSTG